MNLEISEKERKILLELLEEHLYYGWIEQEGEFRVVASGRVSPTLKELFRRIRAGGEGEAGLPPREGK